MVHCYKTLEMVYVDVFFNSEFKSIIDSLAPPETSWPAAELVRAYAQDAQPIVAELSNIAIRGQPVWLPITLSGRSNQGEITNGFLKLAKCLSHVFADAFHRGDHERALQMLKLLDRCFGESYPTSSYALQMTLLECRAVQLRRISDSLKYRFWSADELERLLELLDKPHAQGAESIPLNARGGVHAAKLESIGSDAYSDGDLIHSNLRSRTSC